MFRKVAAYLLCVQAFFRLVSCSPEGPDSGASVSISLRSQYLGAEAGSAWVSVGAQGSWTITLSFDGPGGWATVEPSSGSGTRADIRLRYEGNDTGAQRSVTLELRSGAAVSSTSAVQSHDDGQGGGSEGSKGGTDTATFGWLELPATTSGDGLSFFSRDMEGRKYVSRDKNGMRNWSNYWDNSEHLSLWVAYPLNNALRSNGSRTNAWGLDPQLRDSDQPDLRGGSYGGGWARGHQIPSADRLPYAANVTTFYGTNMTPQNNQFNGGIWARLEEKVRDYASRADTLYVVTGCLYKDSEQVSGRSSGFAVRIPTHYFKALLYRGSSTYATAGGFNAAGFLLPHDSSISGESCFDYIMSIDELEEHTGIDFFPGLGAVTGEANASLIEAESPDGFWK